MTIQPGWYAVPGTTDVRWWDGRAFREVTLVDGVPRYRFSWGLPAGNYVMGTLVLVIFAVVGLFLDREATLGVPVMTIACGLIAAVLAVVAALAVRTARLAPPTDAAIETADVQPLPGTTEPSLIAAGWYAGPAKDKPRWWTGKQWSDYLLAYGQPHPASGQAARVQRILRRAMWVAFAIVLVCAGVGIFAGVAENVAIVTLVTVGGIIALAVGIGCRLNEHRAMKPFIRPMLPPTGERLA